MTRRENSRAIETPSERLHFQEEMMLLSISLRRVFRRAVEINAEGLPSLPDVESEAAESVGGLDKAIAELDEARDGKTDVDAALAEWKQELSVCLLP